MGLVVGTILAFMYLDAPWRYLAIAPLALWEVFEIWLYFNLRGKRSITGHEALIGEFGRAHTTCAPEGQVLVKGQLWRARCPEGVEAGERIVVTHVEGLQLTIAPRDRTPAAPGG